MQPATTAATTASKITIRRMSSAAKRSTYTSATTPNYDTTCFFWLRPHLVPAKGTRPLAPSQSQGFLSNSPWLGNAQWPGTQTHWKPFHHQNPGAHAGWGTGSTTTNVELGGKKKWRCSPNGWGKNGLTGPTGPMNTQHPP